VGFSNTVAFGNLRFSGLLDWQHGGSLVSVTQDVLDAFGASGDQADGGVERATKNDQLGIAQYVYDASFVKLRELSVAYELPASLATRLMGSARSVRLELSGRNLKTWTSYPGLDPEVSNFGSQQISRFIDLAPYPPSRSYFVSLAVGF
jgi:hypothetical protein